MSFFGEEVTNILGQPSLFLLDLKGQEYPAVAEVNRKKRANGQREISLSFYYDEINASFLHDIEFGWKILFKGEWYTITGPTYTLDGDKFNVGVDAVLSFFVDMNGHYLQDEVEDKSRIPSDYFTELFDGTGYNFVLVDNLNANTLNYQANQSKTERFLYGIDRFKGEYKIQGKLAYIHGLVGSDKDVILHEDLNIQDVSIEVDASGFHTWARGFGDKDESKEDADYELETKYESPLIKKYGYIEGPAIRDGKYKKETELKEAIKKQVENSIKISTTVTAIDLTNNGYPEMQFEEGDRVWLYVTDLKQNQQVRVVEIEEVFDWEGNIIDAQYTLGNEGIAARYKSQQYNTLSDFRDIQNGKKTLEFNWLPEAIKRASDIINGNLDSHFEYHAGEIIGINRSNPNEYMRFNTDGLGFSRDGGKTYISAITHKGINADYGVFGTLRSIMIEAVDIYGSYIEGGIFFTGSDENYTEISNAKLTARGTFKRTWLGNTNTYDIRTMLQNGYVRFRNDSEKSSLYLSWDGMSTYADGEGSDETDGSTNGSSGSVRWWDTDHSPTGQKGITVNSWGGTAALVSDWHHALIKSRYSTDIKSTESNIKITSHSNETNRGFTFTKSQDRLDGYLLFGDNDTTGLRFNRSSNGIVQVVDANNTTGGSTEIEAGLGTFNIVRRRSGTNYLSLQNENYFKVGQDSTGARVASEVIERTTNGGSANVRITNAGTLGKTSSASKYKYAIDKQYTDANKQLSHSKQILNLSPTTWYDKFECDVCAKEIEQGKTLSDDDFKLSKHTGFTAEDVRDAGLNEHVEYRDGEVESIEYDRLWIHLIPIIKDQQARIEELEAEK